LLVLLGFILAYQHIKPAPPDRIVIASGEKSGAYHKFAQRYKALLEKEGITLEIADTKGSVDNLQLLKQGKVDLAFVQGGVADPEQTYGQLRSLGSLYYEPLWFFHRKGLDVSRIPKLKGLKVALGPEGSGTQALVKQLLADNAVQVPEIELLALQSVHAAERLRKGEIDVAFFVASPESGLVLSLLHDQRVGLAGIQRAAAYARRHPFLVELMLPEGAEDLARNIPSRNVPILATTTELVIRQELHPAIASLMMQVIDKVHRPAGWFNSADEFPRPDHTSFPLSEQADHYYRHGPPFLQRYLPFWAASLLDRMKIMILPLLGLLLPLFKVVPPLYRWRMRARIYRWYEQLEDVDKDASLASQEERAEFKEKLDELEREVRDIKVPLSFSYQLYHLRLHIDFVRRKLLKS